MGTLVTYNQHKMLTTYGEVDAGDSIHDDEDVGVCQILKAEVEPGGEHEDEHL